MLVLARLRAQRAQRQPKERIVHNNELLIGPWSSKRRSVVLFDMQAVNNALQKHHIETVDGIIGADILQSVNAIIDYKNDWLYLR